jgi:hypothetical protein
MKTRELWAIVLVVVFGSGLLNAQNARRDGNWWNTRERLVKTDYIIGFYDGMDLGNYFSYWKLPTTDPCNAKAFGSYNELIAKYLKDISNVQLVDGLDDFYKDYRNRAIIVSKGVWVVLRSIAGTPKDELEKLIENLRRNPG